MKKLKFKKFDWVVVEKGISLAGVPFYKYRVYRKYFKRTVPLSNTDKSYFILKTRWDHLEKRLKQNPNFHYNMELWSGVAR